MIISGLKSTGRESLWVYFNKLARAFVLGLNSAGEGSNFGLESAGVFGSKITEAG